MVKVSLMINDKHSLLTNKHLFKRRDYSNIYEYIKHIVGIIYYSEEIVYYSHNTSTKHTFWHESIQIANDYTRGDTVEQEGIGINYEGNIFDL